MINLYSVIIINLYSIDIELDILLYLLCFVCRLFNLTEIDNFYLKLVNNNNVLIIIVLIINTVLIYKYFDNYNLISLIVVLYA